MKGQRNSDNENNLVYLSKINPKYLLQYINKVTTI